MKSDKLNPSHHPTSFDGANLFPKLNSIEPSEPHDLLSQHIKLATLVPNVTSNDLDYECVPVNVFPNHQNPNRITLPATVERSTKYLYPRDIASEPKKTLVYAVTGTTGLIKGTLFEYPYHIKLSHARKCEEMWRVRFERDTNEFPTIAHYVILLCKFF